MKSRFSAMSAGLLLVLGCGSASATVIFNSVTTQQANVNALSATVGGLYGAATQSVGFGGYPADIFVRGSFNDWGLADQMAFDGGTLYTAEIDLGAGLWEFKIASEDWSTVDLGDGGSGDNAVLLDVARQIGPGPFGNLFLDISMAGLYLFSLDLASGLDSPTLLVSAVTVVSEPATWLLIGMPLVWIVVSRRRRASRQ